MTPGCCASGAIGLGISDSAFLRDFGTWTPIRTRSLRTYQSCSTLQVNLAWARGSLPPSCLLLVVVYAVQQCQELQDEVGSLAGPLHHHRVAAVLQDVHVAVGDSACQNTGTRNIQDLHGRG